MKQSFKKFFSEENIEEKLNFSESEDDDDGNNDLYEFV